MENLQITALPSPPSASTGASVSDAPADAAELLSKEFRALLVQQINDLKPAAAAGEDPANPDAPADPADLSGIKTDAAPQSVDPLALSIFPYLPPPATQPPTAPAVEPLARAARDNAVGGVPVGIQITPDTGATPEPAPAHGHDTPLISARTAANHGENLPQPAERTVESAISHHDAVATSPLPQLAFAHSLPTSHPTATAIATTHPQINMPVGATGWDAELGQKVVWMINDKQHVAELRVNPPELGPLDIKLTIDDHQTTAVFASPHSAVREAVESALPRLREVLAESGIMLGNASVTADSPRDGSAYTPQRQSPSAPAEPIADSLSARTRHPTPASARGRGLVDLFA